jgi:hypothetical protein
VTAETQKKIVILIRQKNPGQAKGGGRSIASHKYPTEGGYNLIPYFPGLYRKSWFGLSRFVFVNPAAYIRKTRHVFFQPGVFGNCPRAFVRLCGVW